MTRARLLILDSALKMKIILMHCLFNRLFKIIELNINKPSIMKQRSYDLYAILRSCMIYI